MIISKCWNIVRLIADSPDFVPQYMPQIETTLLPLFDHLQYPEKNSFDDEILKVVTSFLKKAQRVTPAMQRMF